MIAQSTDIRFALADESHNEAICRLLRHTPMAGDISVCLQREPNYFAAFDAERSRHWTIVAIDLHDRVVCAGSVSVRRRFINGQNRRVGYLGQLRLAESHAGRADLLRRGFQFFRELLPSIDAELYFTSIAAENTRAIRFLEAGVRGMPCYPLVGNLVTLLLPTIAGKTGSNAAITHGIPNRLDVLNDFAREYQFAPAPTEDDLPEKYDMPSIHDASGISACGGIWDRRAHKQTVIAGYSPRMSIVRPLYNAFARSTGRVRLPPPSAELAHAYIYPLASRMDRPDALVALVRQLARVARERGIEVLTIGFDQRDPRLAVLDREFKARRYLTRIYTVTWPAENSPHATLDDRLMFPEVALL